MSLSTQFNNAYGTHKHSDYSHFVAMASVTEDIEYKNMFEDMATGTFPQGFKFDKNKLTYHSGKNTTIIVLPEDPIEAGFHFIKIMNRKGMRSTDEIASRRKKIVASQEKGWSVVKSVKSQRDHINGFLDRISIDKSLTEAQDRQLRELVFMAYCCDVLESTIVEYSHGGITKINGLSWNSVKKIHTLVGFDYTNITK